MRTFDVCPMGPLSDCGVHAIGTHGAFVSPSPQGGSIVYRGRVGAVAIARRLGAGRGGSFLRALCLRPVALFARTVLCFGPVIRPWRSCAGVSRSGAQLPWEMPWGSHSFHAAPLRPCAAVPAHGSRSLPIRTGCSRPRSRSCGRSGHRTRGCGRPGCSRG